MAVVYGGGSPSAPGGSGPFSLAGAADSLAQTAANANVLTVTVGGADTTYMVSMNACITSFSSGALSMKCDFTDEGNTARTANVVFTQTGTSGTWVNSQTAAGVLIGHPLVIRAKAGTDIVCYTTGTFGTLTYDVCARIYAMPTS